MVLSGDSTAAEIEKPLLRAIEQISQVFTDQDSRRILNTASDRILEGDHYAALKALRLLLPREARLFAARTP
jgi:flagellar protein FlbT